MDLLIGMELICHANVLGWYDGVEAEVIEVEGNIVTLEGFSKSGKKRGVVKITLDSFHEKYNKGVLDLRN